MAHLKSLFSWTLEPRGRRFFSCSNEPRGRGGQEAGEVLAFPPPLGTDSMRRMPRPRWSEAEPRCERLIADGAANAATEVRPAHCGRREEETLRLFPYIFRIPLWSAAHIPPPALSSLSWRGFLPLLRKASIFGSFLPHSIHIRR